MNRFLIKKIYRESRWLLLGCGATLFAFCWLRVWMVSRLATDRFKTILEMLPGDWRRFLSVDIDWLITYPGRISLAYQELLVLLCLAFWSIARGSDAISGELNRGTLEMLLAQPLSRARIYLTQAATTLGGVALLSLAAFAGTAVGVFTTTIKEEVRPQLSLPFYLPGLGAKLPLPFGEPTEVLVPMSEKVDIALFWPATLNLFSLGVMMSGLALMISAWDRYRWRTIGIASGILIVQVIIKIAGMASDQTRWLKFLSILSAYEPESFVRVAHLNPGAVWSFYQYDAQGNWSGFGLLACSGLFLTVGLVCLIAGHLILQRRDLPAPT